MFSKVKNTTTLQVKLIVKVVEELKRTLQNLTVRRTEIFLIVPEASNGSCKGQRQMSLAANAL